MTADEPSPDSQRTQAATAEQDSTSASLSAASAPPGYHLLDEIGRGGMGVVFRAHDLSLDREVAVKLLLDQFPAGSRTAAKFLEEARITARLQHPGIPAVHQVGALPNGRPFLAMKLIKGDTLDQRLKRRADPTAERTLFLSHFEAVAQAVAYAHSRRVIHRDLKPQNVMVGAFGEVQVMDWGLAKICSTPADEKRPDASGNFNSALRTPHADADGTQFGQFMGTPAYMPPEQAIGAVDQIDERSDVFGLGAILCTILTGHPPFHGSDAETTRQLSARGKVEDAYARLDDCGAEPDLIALAKRCLAVERADRPADAGSVARAIAELRTAAEERARNRLAARSRRRILALAGVALVIVLSAGTVVSVWQAIRATHAEQDTAAQLQLTQAAELKERDARTTAEQQRSLAELNRTAAEEQRGIAERQKTRAVEQRDEADRQKRIAEAARNFLIQMIGQTSPWDQFADDRQGNPNLTMREALDRASKQIATEFQDNPLVEEALRETIGDAYQGLSLYAAAEPHLRRAVELQAKRVGGENADLLDTLVTLSDVVRKQGKLAEAEPLIRRSIAKREAVLGKAFPSTLDSVRRLAYLREDQGRPAEAEGLHRRVAMGYEKANGFDNFLTLTSWASLADCLVTLRRPQDAVDIYRRVIPAWEKLQGADYPSTLFAVNGLAMSYQSLGKNDLAAPLFERASQGLTKVLGPDHHEALIAKENYGRFLREAGDLTRAETIQKEVLAARERLSGPRFYKTLHAYNQLALTYQYQNKPDQAEPLFRRAIDGLEKASGPDHPDSLDCMDNLATLYRFQGRLTDAEPIYLVILERKEKRFGAAAVPTLIAVNNLGTLREAQGRYAEAEECFRRAIVGLKAELGPDHRETTQSEYNLAYVFMSQSRYADARPWLERVVPRYVGPDGFTHANGEAAMHSLIIAYEELKRFDLAAPYLRKLLDHRRRTQPTDWITANTASRYGRALLATNQAREAEEMMLTGFNALKAQAKEIPLEYRGVRIREAAERLVELYESKNEPAQVAKWRATMAEYREQAPAPRPGKE